MSEDGLGTLQDPNVAAASERGKFGAVEPAPKYPDQDKREELLAQIEDLARIIIGSTEPDPPSGVAAGNTNADGNAFIPIYQVAAGEQFRAHRLVVECAGYTPAAPYTNAGTGWMGFYSLDQSSPPQSYTGIGDVFQGALKELAPSTVGGPLFPALFTDNSHQALEVRGPRILVLVVVGGPASKRVTVNYQGSLRRAKGIA